MNNSPKRRAYAPNRKRLISFFDRNKKISFFDRNEPITDAQDQRVDASKKIGKMEINKIADGVFSRHFQHQVQPIRSGDLWMTGRTDISGG